MEDFEKRKIAIEHNISKGFIQEALNKARPFVKRYGNKSQSEDLILISSQFNKFRRKDYLGLKPDEAIENRIDAALLILVRNIVPPPIDKRKRSNSPTKNYIKSKKYVGWIRYMNNHQRYGFIQSRSFEGDIFFHFSSIGRKKSPIINQRVTFVINKNEKGFYAEKLFLEERKKNRKKPKTEEAKEQKLLFIEDQLQTEVSRMIITFKKFIRKFFTF